MISAAGLRLARIKRTQPPSPGHRGICRNPGALFLPGQTVRGRNGDLSRSEERKVRDGRFNIRNSVPGYKLGRTAVLPVCRFQRMISRNTWTGGSRGRAGLPRPDPRGTGRRFCQAYSKEKPPERRFRSWSATRTSIQRITAISRTSTDRDTRTWALTGNTACGITGAAEEAPAGRRSAGSRREPSPAGSSNGKESG